MDKTICIDFDGPINPYTGWKGKGMFEIPDFDTIEAIKELKRKGWTIIVHTCRSEKRLIINYLNDWGIPFDHFNYNPRNTELELSTKPVADVYLDDRAICFEGSWDGLVDKIESFKPHYQKVRDEQY